MIGVMSMRRQVLLDAAIRVLGRDGPRGLTHRATDLEAGLPEGSTANLFGRRAGLLGGVVERMRELDYDRWQRLWPGQRPAEAGDLADALVAFVNAATDPGMAVVMRARYFVQLDQPHAVRPGSRAFTAELEGLLAAVGASADRAEPLLALVDGLLLRVVTFGRDVLPGDDELASCVLRLINDE